MPIRPVFRRVNKYYGCRRDARDARDLYYNPDPSLLANLPPVVDLRQWCPPVMDQGKLGSCTANAITGVLRYSMLKAGKPDIPLSRLQLYFDERDVEGTIESDAGAEIRDGIKCAANLGVAHEDLWPYHIDRWRERPPSSVYDDALKFQALEFKRVRIGVDDDGNHIGANHVRAALAEKFPVIIGVAIYLSFESEETARTGMVPMPNLDAEEMLGGHCMYLWGYGTRRYDLFGDRNSWHDDWGDRGDCYLPDQFVGSPRFGADYWIIPKAEFGA